MKNITLFPKTGLFYKIASLVLFTLILAIGISTALSIREQTGIIKTGLIQKNKIISKHLGSSIRNAFWSLNWLFVEKQMQEITESKDVTFLEIIKPNGEVYMAFGDKALEEGVFVPGLMNQEKQVLKDGLYSKSAGQTEMIITPIKVGDDKWILIMGISLKEAEEAKKSILKENIAWGGGILLLGVLVSFWFARGMTRPIKQLVEGTKEIGRGNLDYKIDIKGLDELGELAGSFNDMAEDLKKTTTSRDLLAAEIKERKQAEQALRESEERFRIAAETASDLIYEWDIATDHLEWFGDIDGALGFEPGEFERTIEAWLALIHPDDQERLAAEVSHHRESGEPLSTEYSIMRNDGTWRYWTDRGLAIIDDTGKPHKLIGVCTDITDRQQAQDEIVAARDYTQNIIKSIIDILIVVDPDGKIRTVNPAAADLLGYKEDELIGTPVGTLFAEEVFQGTKLAVLVEKGAVKNVDVTYRARDGRKIPMSLTGSAMKDRDGNLSAVVAVARDMREIRQFISDLHAARVFSEGLVTTIPSGLAALDKEGRVLSINPAFSALFGDGEPRGRHLISLVPSVELEDALRRALIEGREIRNLEIRQAIRGREEAATFNVTVAGLRIGEEEATRQLLPDCEMEQRAKVLVVFDDITERKCLTSELEANLKELKRTQAQLVQTGKMSAVGELASGVAHEMNNPLTGVLTYAVLLKETLEKAPQKIRTQLPEFPERLDLIKRSAQRCKSIADNLLTFSRQSESEMTPVDLSDVISRTFELMAAQMRQRQIKLISKIPEGLPPIRGNPNQLQHVFTNIAINAIHAMDSAGEITVCTRADGPECEVTISDTGRGIPRENLDRIFDPFFTTKPIGRGTGLGLSIAYGIIQNHGGEITVDSVVGRGTRFKIKLPVVSGR